MSGFDLIIQPDEEDAEAAEVLVDGTIGGHPYRFLLDTGAARTSVLVDDYTATFASVETHGSSGVFASHSNDVVTVPMIEVGPISRSDFTLVRKAGTGPDTRNLIGMDLLKDYCCHFLFDESRVLVDPEGAAGASYPFQELFLDERSHPYVDVQLGEATAKTVWDSGAGITVADMRFIEKHPGFFQELRHSKGTDSTGAEMHTPMFVMATTLIGGYEFAPHAVAGVDLSHVNSTIEVPMDLILGYTTLSKAHWLFDFPQKRWAISKLLGRE